MRDVELRRRDWRLRRTDGAGAARAGKVERGLVMANAFLELPAVETFSRHRHLSQDGLAKLLPGAVTAAVTDAPSNLGEPTGPHWPYFMHLHLGGSASHR